MLINDQYTVYSQEKQHLEQPQYQALVKWARRPCKKRLASLQVSTSLNHVRFYKPLGSRMGSGRGRRQQRLALINQGQPLLTYRHARLTRLSVVKHFFSRSNLGLILLAQKL